MGVLVWGFVVSALAGYIQFNDSDQAPGHLQQYQDKSRPEDILSFQHGYGPNASPERFHGQYSGHFQQTHRQLQLQPYPYHNNHYGASTERRSHLYGQSFENETCIPFLGLPTTNFKLANLKPSTQTVRKCISEGKSSDSIISVDCDATQILPSQSRWDIIEVKKSSTDPKTAYFQLQNQQNGKCLRVPQTSTTSDGRLFPTLETCDKTQNLQIFRAFRCAYSTGSDGKTKLDYWRLETTLNEMPYCLTHNPAWPPNPHFWRCDSDSDNDQWFTIVY